MNKKEIEEMIRFIVKAGVREVSIETKELKITVKNHEIAHAAPPSPQNTLPATAMPKAKASVKKEAAVKEDEKPDMQTIKSPMIGTFYRATSPDKPNFINVGDEISQGKIICIIEAMKLFNEIESDVAGKIVKVLVENASPVEYDQPLFLVEPA